MSCTDIIDTTLQVSDVQKTNYLKAFETFVDNLDFIRTKKKNTSRSKDLNLFGEIVKYSDSSIDLSFIKPKYKLHTDLCIDVENELKDLLNEYQFYKKIYLYGSDKQQKDVYEEMSKLTTKISKTHECKAKLADILNRHKEQIYSKKETIRQSLNEKESVHKEFIERLSITNDDIEQSHIVNDFIEHYASTTRDSKETLEKLESLKGAQFLSFDMIVKAPKVESLRGMVIMDEDVESDNQSRPVKKTKKTVDDKLKEKIKKAVKKRKDSLTTDGNAKISDSKDIEKARKKQLKKFLFKTVTECEDTKRSGVGYMTKEQILDVIEQNPSIKAKLPLNYKKIKKTDLCKEVDKTGKIDTNST